MNRRFLTPDEAGLTIKAGCDGVLAIIPGDPIAAAHWLSRLFGIRAEAVEVNGVQMIAVQD